MGFNMTLRLTDKEQETLKILSTKLTYSGIKSKTVRFALEFTKQCLDKVKYNPHDNVWTVREKLDKKFKTDADQWNTR